MSRIWIKGEYCIFHPDIAEKNREKTKFVHSKTKEKDGTYKYFKFCPKCYRMFTYPEGIQITTPGVITDI